MKKKVINGIIAFFFLFFWFFSSLMIIFIVSEMDRIIKISITLSWIMGLPLIVMWILKIIERRKKYV